MARVHSYAAHAVARALTPRLGGMKAKLLASVVDNSPSNLDRFIALARNGIDASTASGLLKRAGYTARVNHDLCAVCNRPVYPKQTSAIDVETKVVMHEGCAR